MKTPLNNKAPRPAGTGTGGGTPSKRRESNTPPARFQKEILAELRERLPQYLRRLGMDFTEKHGRLLATCPCHDDSKPSFAVFPGRKHCGCFPCGWQGDVFAFAEWTGRANDFRDAVRHVAGVLGVTLPDDDESPPRAATAPAMPKPKPKPELPNLTDEQRARIHAARLRFSDALHAGEDIISEIARSLGITRETLTWAARGDCGLALDGPAGLPPWLCYAYPGGLKYRNPHKGTGPRFVWLCGRATAPWRMGWARNSDVRTVYLTEGESDALALIETGIEADGTAAVVASPGTSFPREWAPMFRGKRVVLCFDVDGPGTAAAATVAATLKGHAREILRWKGGGE